MFPYVKMEERLTRGETSQHDNSLRECEKMTKENTTEREVEISKN